MLDIKFRAYDTVEKKIIEWDKLKHIPLFFENPNFNISRPSGYPDKNGVELYTDDIVEWKGYLFGQNERMFRHICVVVEDKKEFCGMVLLSLKDIKSGYIPLGKYGATTNEITKIGNIFINPELLTDYD